MAGRDIVTRWIGAHAACGLLGRRWALSLAYPRLFMGTVLLAAKYAAVALSW